jgi:hypothetical protein
VASSRREERPPEACEVVQAEESRPGEAEEEAAGREARGGQQAAPASRFRRTDRRLLRRQSPELRPILEELRVLADEALPDAEASIKWGMPVYTIGGAMVVALRAHRSHVNLILSGPSAAFSDPEGQLEGEGKLGRHLKLTSLDDLPRPAVRAWMRTAAELARKKK